jgi:CRP/FNR family cyclic AMP-dependent transcriptional regulator
MDTQTPALTDILADQPFLKGLTPEQLATIAECAHPVTFRAGEYLFREMEPANHFYILTHGQVALEVHVPGRGAQIIQTVADREALGWSWLFPPYQWHFDGRAVTLIRAIDFNGLCLRGKCDSDHDLGYALMQRFALTITARLQATRMQLIEAYDAYQR